MIASLKGTIKETFPGFIIIDVAGVGYKVEGINTYLEIGAEIDILVFTHYTQQDVKLFGFLNKESYLLFQDLIIVSGVGPKTAVTLINNLGVENIKTAIINSDAKALTGNGVGLKSAQKIIIELISKIEKSGFKSTDKKGKNDKDNQYLDEVEQALLGLGYNKNEISQVLSKINITKNSTSESLLREALNKILNNK